METLKNLEKIGENVYFTNLVEEILVQLLKLRWEAEIRGESDTNKM